MMGAFEKNIGEVSNRGLSLCDLNRIVRPGPALGERQMENWTGDLLKKDKDFILTHRMEAILAYPWIVLEDEMVLVDGGAATDEDFERTICAVLID
jgi:hypothetical protein